MVEVGKYACHYLVLLCECAPRYRQWQGNRTAIKKKDAVYKMANENSEQGRMKRALKMGD